MISSEVNPLILWAPRFQLVTLPLASSMEIA